MVMAAASGASGAAAGAPDLGLGELAAFVVLAEERSFTRSARRLHLSQPGLSARIARLERALGVRLVNRTTRSVELTAAGEQLLPVASEAVESFARVRARLAAGEARRRDLVAEARSTHFR
jgi:DNA-binding transcriptional LysR family regulator